MIIKASQRAYGQQLAAHLLNVDDNEHVTVHEVTGFVGDDLYAAFAEAKAHAKATRATKYLFSLSLNPPQHADVPMAGFEAAATRIEAKLGLCGQPRVMVVHEKHGRQHAHIVWSRIRTDEMKAVPLPHFKTKLMDIARELYLEHRWEMPNGLKQNGDASPTNYNLEEHQQAKRAKRDPEALKAMFQDCWSRSDSADGFKAALREQGFALARGDRRKFVAVDHDKEIYSLSRWCKVKTKALKERLGETADYPDIETAYQSLQKDDLKAEREALAQQRAVLEAALRPALRARRDMIERHRAQRAEMVKQQTKRHNQETRGRAARFAKGLRGLVQFITGKRAKLREQNAAEAATAKQRDQSACEQLGAMQRRERRQIDRHIKARELALQAVKIRQMAYEQGGAQTAPRHSLEP